MTSQLECLPLEAAQPQQIVRLDDVALTSLKAGRDDVFVRAEDLGLRYARLQPVDTAYEVWRGSRTLAMKIRGRQKAWPVRTVMRSGIELCEEVGLEPWEAEQHFHGLVARKPKYVRLATGLLLTNTGFTLALPGEVTIVFVAESDFAEAVVIDDPIHLSGPPVFV